MGVRRGRGFTLIELLVVIAIIGILAAMLFPVFARARESARKVQCLSNVKNIGMAVQMYLSDYDAFPPSEHRQEVIDYLYTQPGGGNECRIGGNERVPWMADLANPFIQWPVVFDEYIKNRDVWRCPSGRLVAGASFIVGGGGNWLGYLAANQGKWGDAQGWGPCDHMTFPSGWGGDVTDSIIQQRSAGTGIGSGNNGLSGGGANGTFIQGISTMQENFYDMKQSSIVDASTTPVCADGGVNPTWMTFSTMAYPDICCAECSGVAYYAWGGWPPSDSEYCGGCACHDIHANIDWARDPARMKASARHMGGDNVGFADGHAKWFAAAAITAMSDSQAMQKLGWTCSPGTSSQGYAANCGAPANGMQFLYNIPLSWSGW